MLVPRGEGERARELIDGTRRRYKERGKRMRPGTQDRMRYGDVESDGGRRRMVMSWAGQANSARCQQPIRSRAHRGWPACGMQARLVQRPGSQDDGTVGGVANVTPGARG
nr:hypothetical protein CFP56_07829 [Quercus suber]